MKDSPARHLCVCNRWGRSREGKAEEAGEGRRLIHSTATHGVPTASDTVLACLGIKGEQARQGASLSPAGVGAFTGQAGEDYSTQGLGELLEEDHVFL